MQRVLVRRRAGVDAVPRILEALVERRIEQQAAMCLDHRQHGLARARHVAGEQQPDAVDLEQPFGEGAELLRVGGRIIHHRLDRTAEHAAAGIDLLDRKQGGVELCPLDPDVTPVCENSTPTRQLPLLSSINAMQPYRSLPSAVTATRTEKLITELRGLGIWLSVKITIPGILAIAEDIMSRRRRDRRRASILRCLRRPLEADVSWRRIGSRSLMVSDGQSSSAAIAK